MTRCLKRVHNCKLWEDLNRTYAPVDYTQMLENEDNTRRLHAARTGVGGGAPEGARRAGCRA
jgi:hypothetical protein